MKTPSFDIIQTFKLFLLSFVFCASGYSQSITFSNIWYIAPLSRAYVGNGANERGVAINPVNRHVYIVSRSAPVTIKILNGDDGTEIGNLDITGITGGAIVESLIGVGDDGVIYVANVSTSTVTPGFKVYRWSTEASTPTVAFGPGLSTVRWGDSFRVRGAGTNTQIAVSGSSNPKVAILTTTDGLTFTGAEILLSTAGLAAGDANKAIAFGPGGTNTLYLKTSSANLRYVSFDLTALTFSLIRTITMDSSMCGVAVDNTNNFVFGVLAANSTTTANQRCKFYDISIPTIPALVVDTNFPAPTYANGNATAYADTVSDLIVCLDTSNGLLVFKRFVVAGAVPPAITSQPQGAAVLQGGYYTMTVGATGTQPKFYQWYFPTTANPINGQTNLSLALTNVGPADAGNYSVIVSNSAGSATSAVAAITITPTVSSGVATRLWTLSPGSRPYISTDGTQRSVGYNAVNDHLVFVSRTPVSAIYVLSAATGADINTMSLSGVSFGTFDINLAGVADDGVVYGANLVTTGSAGYKIYRWDNDSSSTIPTTIYGTGNASSPEQTQRWGDTFDVRGAGTNTQILAGEQAGGKVAIFTTTDGTNFNLHLITTDATTENTRIGLAFGYGNTYWSKSSGTLRKMSFDLTTDTGATLLTYVNSDLSGVALFGIGVDATNNLLAGVSSTDNPHDVRFYDVGNSAVPPVWLDTEFFPTSNGNGNNSSFLKFGGGRAYAVDANNGLMTMTINYAPIPPVLTIVNNHDGTITVTWANPAYILQSSTTVDTGYTDVPSATSPYTESASVIKFFRLRK